MTQSTVLQRTLDIAQGVWTRTRVFLCACLQLLKSRIFHWAFALATGFVFALYTPPPIVSSYQSLLDRGSLIVGTRLGPMVYYERDDEAAGLDYFLLSALAFDLGLELDIRVYDNLTQLLLAATSGQVDMISAMLTVTEKRQQELDFSYPYLDVQSIVVQHSSGSKINDLSELDSEFPIIAMEGSSHAEQLEKLSAEYAGLNWIEDPVSIMFSLLQQVQNGDIKYAVVDSTLYELERPFFPRTEIALAISEPEPAAMAVAKSHNPILLKQVDHFLQEYEASGDLEALKTSFFSDNEPFNVAGSLLLRRRLEERLPDFEPIFREVADEYEMDWVMLAAIAYQESHWDAEATSFTGVRGLMMLTLPTAREYDIEDRLDPEQSVRGGTQYVIHLRNRLPDRIPEPDRTKMALAAYNIGFGHLEDARVLTQRGGDNPDVWEDVREYLPLLQKSQFYKTVRRGYARGAEAQAYVDNIYHFYNIIESHAWQRELEAVEYRVEFEDEMTDTNVPYRDILDGPLAPQ